MKFSILTPVAIKSTDAQRADMLVECLENANAQTHQDFEIILKDAYHLEPVIRHKKVRDILHKMQSKVNYICLADTGMTDGLNQALWHATGQIMHIVCGDDMLGHPLTLEYVKNSFLAVPSSQDPHWMYGSTKCINEDGTEGPWGIQPPSTLEEMLIHNRMGTPATYWNRAMFEKVGYFEYALASDYDYWCRCYRISKPMYTERILGCGRRWSQAASWVDAQFVEDEARDIAIKHHASHARHEQPNYVAYEGI